MWTCLLMAGLAGRAAAAAAKPNIVLFLQDDQDLALGGWQPMNQAQNLLAAAGATSSNWFIHTPVCCPSRAELLSGRYFHNVRESTPSGGCMHVDEAKVNPVSFGYYLGEAGYTLGWFGKHMNSCPHLPPPGYDCPTCWWFANGGGSDGEPGGYLNASFSDYAGAGLAGKVTSVNGTYKANTAGEFAGYTTSVIANKSIEWLKTVAPLGKPWVVTVASKAPHVPATPAPWYANHFSDLAAPRSPAYNASTEVLADHHWLIAQQGPITAEQGATIDELFRNRWRCLLSVDDALAGLHATVKELGMLDNTYWFVTSDHGYNLGQHRLPSCKLNVYDHDIRIPMVMAGPGIAPGSFFEYPASNVDVGPTMLGLAGLPPAATMDGRSVAPLVVNPSDPMVPEATKLHIEGTIAAAGGDPAVGWRDFHLVEYNSLGSVTRTGHLVDDPHSNTYRAIRSTKGKYGDMLYSEFTALTDMFAFSNVSFYEMYNISADPHQLDNIYHSQPAEVQQELHKLVLTEFQCAGASCQ